MLELWGYSSKEFCFKFKPPRILPIRLKFTKEKWYEDVCKIQWWTSFILIYFFLKELKRNINTDRKLKPWTDIGWKTHFIKTWIACRLLLIQIKVIIWVKNYLIICNFHQIILKNAIIIFYYVLSQIMFKYHQGKGGISEWNYMEFVHLLLSTCNRNNRMFSSSNSEVVVLMNHCWVSFLSCCSKEQLFYSLGTERGLEKSSE